MTSEDVLNNWIHQNYGKPAGLLSDEYRVIFNPEQPFDIGWRAGGCILISIRFPIYPDLDLCKAALRKAFQNPYLLEFRRSKALVKMSDSTKFYSSTFSGIAKELPRKKKKFIIEYMTFVRVKDIKTKAEQTVEIINSNAFEATNKALRMLYGGAEE